MIGGQGTWTIKCRSGITLVQELRIPLGELGSLHGGKRKNDGVSSVYDSTCVANKPEVGSANFRRLQIPKN